MKRMWINQPSRHQPHHELHGVRVLAMWEEKNYAIVFFLSGDTVSMRMGWECLSEGWPVTSFDPEANQYRTALEWLTEMAGYAKGVLNGEKPLSWWDNNGADYMSALNGGHDALRGPDL